MSLARPIVLCFSGHDPSGGAGIQADIEVLVSHQCHAASVITALTEQDTHNVKTCRPQKAEDFLAQAHALLADLPVKIIKIGLIGDVQIAMAIQQLLLEHPKIPVVLDPILTAGGGAALADQALHTAIFEKLLPLTFIATPNASEARQLAQLSDLDACGKALLAQGCRFVLVTGADEREPVICNRLYQHDQALEIFSWDRLPGKYHGSGCTLASSIAAMIAHDLDPFRAIHEAQEYTWNSLSHAYQTGRGQFNPDRLFWMDIDR